MPRPLRPSPRRHLRLVGGTTVQRSLFGGRARLWVRALARPLALLARAVVTWIRSVVAHLPLGLGRVTEEPRSRPARPLGARVIPFERGRLRDKASLR